METYKKISIRHKHFIQEMNSVWESYEVINYYSYVLHSEIKADLISSPTIHHLSANKTGLTKPISKNNTFGVLSHIRDKKNSRTALFEATLIFENYISSIITFVHTDYPHKSLNTTNANDNSDGQEKIYRIILSSTDKNEIIDRLIEEKVRGIFYGNIADIFLKDKAKLELKDTFNSPKGRTLIDNMLEIFARRNIHIHNAGRIDRKYVRETKLHEDKLGTILKIDQTYIRNSINILTEIATMFTCAIMENIYKETPQNKALNRTYWHDNQ